MRTRVQQGLKTTFASHYSHRSSLIGALDVNAVKLYGRKATGQKTLILPQS